jgi:RecA/RadA recombinase
MGDIYFRTGNTILDLLVGGSTGVKGFPAGRFINICGDKSAGKSFICTELIASAYHVFSKKVFKWVYDDCESGYSFDTKKLYGFDIMQNAIVSQTVEEAFINISNFANSLKDTQCGIYVLDSLDGLTSTEQDKQAEARIKAANKGKEYDVGTYGMGKAKYLSREFFPQLCNLLKDKNILVVIVSQIRQNITPFSFEKYVRSGGKALDFYGHTVLWLATLKKIKSNNRVVGVVVKAKTTKSKTPRPFREGNFSIIFDYGVDNIGSNIDYLFDLRGDSGELLAKSKSIAWGSDKKQTTATVKKFLSGITVGKKNNKMTAYEAVGIKRPTLEDMLSFIDSNPDIKADYVSICGETFNRTSLIEHIENNQLEDILEDRVVEKWELLEQSISSNRKPRYANIPEGK